MRTLGFLLLAAVVAVGAVSFFGGATADAMPSDGVTTPVAPVAPLEAPLSEVPSDCCGKSCGKSCGGGGSCGG